MAEKTPLTNHGILTGMILQVPPVDYLNLG